jgi:hypothetical protein
VAVYWGLELTAYLPWRRDALSEGERDLRRENGKEREVKKLY